MCFRQHGDWRQCVSAQEDTQGNMGVPGPNNREADRPHLYCKVVQSNRYQILQELHEDEEGLDINSQWKDIKEAVNYACEEVVGQRKPD